MDSNRLKKRLIVASATVLIAFALTQSAHAAEPSAQEKETARSLMDQADERFDQKDFKAALESYLGAHAIMRVPTTALEVAKAHEALGHLVEARDALLEAVRYPQSSNEPVAYTTARADATRRAGELGDRIPSILMKIENVPRGVELRVSVDGVALPSAAALLPIKVNPGHHQIIVSSEATYDAAKDVDVAEREQVPIAVTLSARPISKDAHRSSSGTLHTVGLIGAGVGIAGLAVGTVFGLRASSKQSEANCPSNVCKDDASAETLRSANSSATVSTIAFIAGGVLTAGGVALWLLTPSKDVEKPKSAHVILRVTPNGPFGITAVGMF